MGKVLDSVTCGDQYSDATTCGPVWPSNGGYFAVTGHDVYCELGARQPGAGSDVVWGSEIHVPVCNGTLFPDTYAIRFRNYRAGQNAVVSAGLFTKAEPTLNVGAASTATAILTGTVNVQHNGALVGTEPSIDFEDGGITWTVTDDAGATRVKIVGAPASTAGAVVGEVSGWAGGGAANVTTQSIVSGIAASGATGIKVPGGTMGANGGVRLVLAGQFEAGTSNETNVIAITFGGVTFWQGSFASNPGGSGYTCEYRLEAIIYNQAAVNRNAINGLLHMNLQSPGAAGDGSAQALQQSVTPIVFATDRAVDHESVNTAVDQYLDVVYAATGSQPRFYRVLAVVTTT